MPSLAAELFVPFVAVFEYEARDDRLDFVEKERLIPIVGPESAVGLQGV